MNLRKHISRTCSSCAYHIRELRRIWKSVSLALATQIAVALVSSKLDHCNSLVYNVPEHARLRLRNRWGHLVADSTNYNFPNSKKTTNLHIWLTYLFGRNAQKYLRTKNSNRFLIRRIKIKTGSRAVCIGGPAL